MLFCCQKRSTSRIDPISSLAGAGVALERLLTDNEEFRAELFTIPQEDPDDEADGGAYWGS